MMADFADAARIRARAWLLDAVIAVDSHPHLVNTNSGEISYECVRNIFNSRKTLIEHTWKGLDFISFSIPKNMKNLHPRNAVPMVAILHGTHDISQNTVQAIFYSVKGFSAAWAPLHFGPGEKYRTLEDHAMYKTFLGLSSVSDPTKDHRVDYKGNSGTRQATNKKIMLQGD